MLFQPAWLLPAAGPCFRRLVWVPEFRQNSWVRSALRPLDRLLGANALVTDSDFHPIEPEGRRYRRDNIGVSPVHIGKNVFVGTPEQVADYMEEWFVKRACDGFNIMPPYIPGALDDFCTLVVPELQRRGLFRTEYEGRTLRENLGLPRPETMTEPPVSKAAGE